MNLLVLTNFNQPRDLLKQYEKLDKDPLLFVHWMKTQCQANTGHARKAFDVVKCFTSEGKGLQKQQFDQKNKINSGKPLLLGSNSAASMPSQSTAYSTATVIKPHTLVVQPKDINDSKDVDGKDALNQHLVKLRKQFTNMHGIANKKMLELQSELGKMQHMSHEFDVLAEFLSSEEKLSIFEQNLDRLQKTVHLTEEKLHEINENNQKMGSMISQINDTAKLQHDSNQTAISKIEEQLARWEIKLDRAARKMSIQKVDVNESKANGSDYFQLKDDIENMLNGRLDELSQNMEWIKNVVFGMIALLVLKMIFIDFNKTNDNMVPE